MTFSHSPLLSWLRHQKKAVSWILLMVFTMMGCFILSPNRVVTATMSNGQSQAQNLNLVAGLVEKSRILYEAENYSAAIEILQQALVEYQIQKDELRQAMVLTNLALAYQQLGEWEKVNVYVDQSIDKLKNIPQNTQKSLILAQTLDIKGKLQLVQGNGDLAAKTWQQATAIYREIGQETGVIRTQLNQAQALQASGYYRRSVKVLKQLETSISDLPDSITKAVGFRSLGNALLLVGDIERAKTALETSLAIGKSLKSTPDISSALFSLGNLARGQLRYQEAREYYQEAATISTDPSQKIKAQLNHLSLLRETQNFSAVPSLLTEINSVITKLPLTHEAIYGKINYAQNLIKLTQANFTVSSKSQIKTLSQNIVKEAQQLSDQPAEAYSLINLGKFYELDNQLKSAQEVTQQAGIIAQNINARDISYQAQWQLGRLLAAQEQDQLAIASYEQAVATIQSLRSDLVAINSETQFTFTENIEPIYRQYVSLLLKYPDSSENNLIAAREALDSLQLAELENFFNATCLDAQPVVIDEITDRDDPTAAIIYPIVLDDRFEIILKLPQQKLRHYSVPIKNLQRVERVLQRLSQSLTQRNSNETLALSQQVYQWLIQPAENDLAQSNINTLVFVLDSPLRNIPMSVLYDGQQYLIEKYAIALAPGLQLVNPRPIAQQQLTALTAGLTEARGDFPPLKYVENELSTVQSQIPRTELLLNDSFTTNDLQAKIAGVPFPVVHLATHGQFSSQAENTFILTWDDRINVNQLNSLLSNRDLEREEAIELLVLSACETLTGDKRAALGLAGVAVRAGARSTLATLWRVNDEASALMMGQFYQELGNQANSITKAEALRQAQLTLLRNPRFNRPHFWSSYVLVGNWL